VLETSPIDSSKDKREAYLQAAQIFFGNAKEKAEAGDLKSAGIFILKALGQEKRAGGVGPQVLQLIKTTH
tara:strand:- start:478 stop:687 length:210 start_codon:yes stop_codon:yes gene_type:complete